MFSQVNIQMQYSMQLKVTMQWNQNIKNRNEKTLTNAEAISIPWSALAEPEKWIGILSGASFGYTDSINQG